MSFVKDKVITYIVNFEINKLIKSKRLEIIAKWNALYIDKQPLFIS
jgi:hypothetical protein